MTDAAKKAPGFNENRRLGMSFFRIAVYRYQCSVARKYTAGGGGIVYLSFRVASPAIAERIARIQNPMTILLSGIPIISK